MFAQCIWTLEIRFRIRLSRKQLNSRATRGRSIDYSQRFGRCPGSRLGGPRSGAAGLGHVHTGQNAPIDTTKKLDKFYVLNSWIVSMLSRQLPQEPRIRLSGRFATDISLGIRDFALAQTTIIVMTSTKSVAIATMRYGATNT